MDSTFPKASNDAAWPSARYALINAAETEDKWWGDLDTLRVVPETLQAYADLFPMLLDLDALNGNARRALTARAQRCEEENGTRFVLALLDTDVTASSLVTHLTRRMHVQRPHGGNDVLRYYDPYVFRHLRWLLTEEQRNSVLGPLRAWHWREPDGTWHAQHRTTPQPSLRPLRLTSEQWPTLLRMADINRALHALACIDPVLAHHPDTAQQLDSLLAEASERYALNEQDRVLYALQGVRYGRSIHRHPLLRRRLLHLDEQGTTYLKACADLDDTRLRQLAHPFAPQHTQS